jgi:thioredoxin reductase
VNTAVHTTDVVVVGSGPAGASCALWLGLQGLRVTVLEQAPDTSALLRRLNFAQDWVLGQPQVSTAQLATDHTAHLRQHPSIRIQTSRTLDGGTRLSDGRLHLTCTEGDSLITRFVVFATGLVSRPYTHAIEGDRLPLDAIALTQERERLQGHRVLLLGGGDNAAENALFLAERGHAVTLWSRSALRARHEFREALQGSPVSVVIDPVMPTLGYNAAQQVWRAGHAVRHEQMFDEVAVLFGFQPHREPVVKLAMSLNGPGAIAPDTLDITALEPQGLYVAGDLAQRMHPCISTAIADGVEVARRIAQRS